MDAFDSPIAYLVPKPKKMMIIGIIEPPPPKPPLLLVAKMRIVKNIPAISIPFKPKRSLCSHLNSSVLQYSKSLKQSLSVRQGSPNFGYSAPRAKLAKKRRRSVTEDFN